MKTRLLIIIGIILIFGVIVVTVISQNQLELNKVTHENLSNLNPIQREELIMKYTETYFNGDFNNHAEIIDLQKEYAVGEPITFTVATWGYGHPCQSPSFVYYYETKNPENIVFEDVFIRWCQPLLESDFMYYYNELDSFRTKHASQSDIFPVFDKPGSYIISVDDKTEYEFQIIEKGNFPGSTYEINRNQLQQVLDYCNDTSGIKNFIHYGYSNKTHSIDNNTCEWKEHGTFPDSEFLCIPYSDKWITDAQITNQTHIFNKDSCTWRIDQDYDTVNSKGCPQFCPKDTEIDKIEDMQEIIIDDVSIFNSTKDISDIPEFEIIDVTPEMWYENQKRAEERNDIRLEQLEKLNNDPDFVKATKIIQGINSTNIEDDAYWQTALDALIIVTEKQGISLNGTLSYEDSEILRELIRQNH